ncbi:hypothetical protein [Agaribacterium haliotis]|uniref:hypothetical protein n=1 Tax=Agaribacterium haliotis TaxID=2013869 RepID=UPI0011782A79|nr:hypothetical protein [Agaribacterium haliotis]
MLEKLPEDQRLEIRSWINEKLGGVSWNRSVSYFYFKYLSESDDEIKASLAVLNKVRDVTGMNAMGMYQVAS